MQSPHTSQHATDLTPSIMRRVYAVWVLRNLVSRRMVQVYIAALVLWRFVQEVSIIDVLRNAPHWYHPFDGAVFFAHALMTTERTVQLEVAVLAVLIAWLLIPYVRRLVRTIRIPSFPLHRAHT